MSYGRKTIGKGLRKAGEAIRNFDDRYSEKIENMYAGYADKAEASGRSMNPLEVAGITAGYAVGGAIPSTRKFQGVENDALKAILPAVSVIPKYVLPAAGVTLAGKG